MKGIQYLVDDTGKKTAVVIDLQQWGERIGSVSRGGGEKKRRNMGTVAS